jgi:BirA family biotin operon repressor/biotin-[acetyl-CoA-carboxylase] ligase
LRRTGTVYDAWLPFVETLGKWVTVRSGDSIEEGRAEAIDVDGSLVLRRPDGSRLTLAAGEVTLHV